MKPATIYDVARVAGVSHQTVTRYLRGSNAVRPETGERVAAAVEQLDYRPNAAARLLRSRHSNRIGLLADRIDANGPGSILAAASAFAHARGYVLDVVVTDGTSPGSVVSSLQVLTEHQVAGIVALANTEVVVAEIRRQQIGVPLVVASELGAQGDSPSTSELAGIVAAEHLLELGHRRVGYLAGPEMWLASQGRAGGFSREFVRGGGEVAWMLHGDWTPESGYDLWSGLDAEQKGITAVAAASDSMAIGLIAAATDEGVDVPSELSVIGTDDLPEVKYVRPSLSTVAMDFEQEGRVLMDALLTSIEGVVGVPIAAPTAPYVIARDSTARRK
ncbi:LacI family DNA-binding transcriptional regulator [Microbacterium sp. NPDC089320]|uniref:LacI family DNA-binding transcriptional regulator n=1 Tax=Microbacterium sp. NPDC089320 TaxID=3155182 RepID=UPI00344AE685